MIIVNHAQGSSEWLAHRRTTHNASDAPVMMGVSPYISRNDLIKQRATGIEREIDAATQYIFDKGHAVEPLLRAMAESIIGEDLYPVTATSEDGYLSASFDGVTLGEDVIFEAKQSNQSKAAHVLDDRIPPADYWQIVQQFAVCETATRGLYMLGDGSPDGTVQLRFNREDVEADIPNLLAGWAQFDADVAAYIPAEENQQVTGRAPGQLAPLRVDVTGMVTFSNLADFKAGALAILGSINRDLQTDADFADAEQTVKWAKGVEDDLESAKARALSQTADIEAVFRTIDEVSAETRRVRLDLDKLVKARKESIKGEIIAAGATSVRQHFDAINATLGQHAFQPAQSMTLDLGAAIKGKRTISSMRDAVDSTAANIKIEASQRAERVRANMALLAAKAGEHTALFPDAVQLFATKSPEDLRNLITARVTAHQERETAKLDAERERIRKEEQERADREAEARERQRIQQEASERAERERGEAKPSPVVAPVAVAEQPAANVPICAKPAPAGERIKLGDINARIAPLSITADGLAQLGFQPVGTERSAKLYNLSDLPVMCEQMRRCLARAASLREAA